MYRPRLIPVLLLKKNFLIKTIRFKEDKYIGDAINAVRLFQEFMADEIIVLDIYASKEQRTIDLDFVRQLNEETSMPFAVGGGIKEIEHIKQLIHAGAEKVVIGQSAFLKPSFIEEAAKHFGSSTIVVCIDYKKDFFGKKFVYIKNGSVNTHVNLFDYAKTIENAGAGEIIAQSIDRDGTMSGYDIETLKMLYQNISIPIVALGGAGSYKDFSYLFSQVPLNGIAAASVFLYHNQSRSVLINYPTNKQELFFKLSEKYFL